MSAVKAEPTSKPPRKAGQTLPPGLTELELYRVYLDYVRHENELINQRNTWFLAAQGFLIAAGGFLLQNGFTVVASVWFDISYATLINAGKYWTMWLVCCWSGIVVSRQALRSIYGARKSQEALEVLWLKASSPSVRAILPDLRGGKDAPPASEDREGRGIGRGLSSYTLRLWWGGGALSCIFALVVGVRHALT
ncbi:hypothetical protein [Sphingomonas sp. G-3-2-10]|uniref:hypothetical protein n=1 Tax=Sphingomonas sp. G-3-2-10 TaxID=2728838 RepID=UPI00146B94AF|nr:hypothetical protein [Sphingomonas sp. G-3-2-10]NML04251.1 hypothetical protein [Sphingomonas sp. G-3-2-10]